MPQQEKSPRFSVLLLEAIAQSRGRLVLDTVVTFGPLVAGALSWLLGGPTWLVFGLTAISPIAVAAIMYFAAQSVWTRAASEAPWAAASGPTFMRVDRSSSVNVRVSDRASIQIGSPQMTVREQAPIAAAVISKRAFRLVDLPMTASIIQGRTFEDCTVYGPAVVASLGTRFEGCRFARTVAREVFWGVNQGYGFQDQVGVIGLHDCIFRRCQFVDIGMVAPPEAQDRIKQSYSNTGDTPRPN